MTTFQPYPEYKDTGLPWCPRIPSHWDLKPNRAFIRQRKVLVGERHSIYTLLSLTKRGVIVRDLAGHKGKHSADMSTFQEVRPDDLVMCLFDVPETPRTIGRSDHYGMITGAYTVFEASDKTAAMWLEAFYIAMDDRKLLSPLYSGLRNTIPRPKFLGTKTPSPTPDEQQRIVSFIGYLNRRVNRFIRNRRQLIKVLNEQKQAIINRAVTRGLDPDGPLKPSGIDWLGDIPEHWGVVALRYLATKFGSGMTPRGGATVYQEIGVPFLRSQNVHFDGLRLGGVARIPPELHASLSATHVRPHDVLLNITGASIGRVCAVPSDFEEGNVNQHVCIIRPRQDEVSSQFLAAYLSSAFMQREIYIEQNGASREGLALDAIRAFKIIVPPLGEQEAIVNNIKSATKGLVAACGKAEREIDLICEYRTRLISDVVTGKLDVRHLASPPGSQDLEESVEALEPIDEATGELDEDAFTGQVDA